MRAGKERAPSPTVEDIEDEDEGSDHEYHNYEVDSDAYYEEDVNAAFQAFYISQEDNDANAFACADPFAVAREYAARNPPAGQDPVRSKSGKRAYVVYNGRQLGVFQNYNACVRSYSGFPDQNFQGYPTLQAAEIAWAHALSTGEWGSPLRTGYGLAGHSCPEPTRLSPHSLDQQIMTAHVDVPQRTVARLATPPSTPGRHMPSASSSAHGLLNSGRTTSQVPQSQVPQSQVPRSQVQQSQPTAKAAPSTGWKREPRTPTSSSSSNEPSPPSTPQRRQATAPPGNLTPSTPRRRGATPVADNYSSPQLHPDAKAIAVANAYAWWVVVIGKEPGVYHGMERARIAMGNVRGQRVLSASSQSDANELFATYYMLGRVHTRLS